MIQSLTSKCCHLWTLCSQDIPRLKVAESSSASHIIAQALRFFRLWSFSDTEDWSDVPSCAALSMRELAVAGAHSCPACAQSKLFLPWRHTLPSHQDPLQLPPKPVYISIGFIFK